jgi:hypothetical protein
MASVLPPVRSFFGFGNANGAQPGTRLVFIRRLFCHAVIEVLRRAAQTRSLRRVLDAALQTATALVAPK